ncbi:MAG: polysaccharide pyruvyl transferase family protein [Bacteroidales bacterium]|nr:polysaccharide pyruvyl transferase family protein [Bacteroidales bacterium]
MKVAILTYHWIHNFGGQLQALATSEALRNLGYEPIVIHLVQPDVKKEFYEKLVPKIQQNAHVEFCNNYLPISNVCETEDDLIQLIDKENIKNIVVGSDAVFFIKYPESPLSDTRYPSLFWMRWIEKCKNYKEISIFSISASCMETNFRVMPSRIIKGLNESLKNFKQITVRDLWTKMFLKRVSLFTRITITPDPVMSFNTYVNKEFLDPIEVPIKGKYILYGLQTGVGNAKKDILLEIKKKVNALGYKFIALPFPEGSFNELDDETIPNPVNPLLWYKLIQNASGILSEKFHPIVVSIHNQVPFFAIDSYGDRVSKKFIIPIRVKFTSKTYDLCKRNGLKNNHIPTSLLQMNTVDKIVNGLCNKQWDFSKSQNRDKEFLETLKGFNFK